MVRLATIVAVLFGFVVIIGGFFIWVALSPELGVTNGDEEEGKAVVPEDAIDEVLGRDAIPALSMPDVVGVADAPWLDTDLVLGLVVGDEARAYPVAILNWHEVVNDVLGETAVVVSFCPLCNTGLAHERRLDDVVYDFGVSGRLYLNALVMYDTSSDSLWSHVTGESISGELVGSTLERLPLLHMTWGQWKRSHPETTVISSDTGFDRDYSFNPYAQYLASPDIGVRGQEAYDPRIDAKILVLGVVAAGGAKAYPLEGLPDNGVVNDEIGEDLSALEPVLIYRNSDAEFQAAYRRRAEGKVLTFVAGPDELTVTDEETGTTWSAVTGKGLSGPLEGETLDVIPVTLSFWFAWSDFYPRTELLE